MGPAQDAYQLNDVGQNQRLHNCRSPGEQLGFPGECRNWALLRADKIEAWANEFNRHLGATDPKAHAYMTREGRDKMSNKLRDRDRQTDGQRKRQRQRRTQRQRKKAERRTERERGRENASGTYRLVILPPCERGRVGISCRS